MRRRCEQAFAAGIGHDYHDAPSAARSIRAGSSRLPITAECGCSSDGRFRSESFGEEWYAGPTAVLEAGNFTLVVSAAAR